MKSSVLEIIIIDLKSRAKCCTNIKVYINTYTWLVTSNNSEKHSHSLWIKKQHETANQVSTNQTENYQQTK